MPTPVGPSHFADVSAVTYNSINIYAVSNIKITRSNEIIKGEDNNKLRPVSTHKVRVKEIVTFETEDVNALVSLNASTGAHNLVFNWTAASQTLTTNALATQTVTIKNVVIESVNTDAISKGWGKGQVQGIVLEVTDDTDPVVFVAAS